MGEKWEEDTYLLIWLIFSTQLNSLTRKTIVKKLAFFLNLVITATLLQGSEMYLNTPWSKFWLLCLILKRGIDFLGKSSLSFFLFFFCLLSINYPNLCEFGLHQQGKHLVPLKKFTNSELQQITTSTMSMYDLFIYLATYWKLPC